MDKVVLTVEPDPYQSWIDIYMLHVIYYIVKKAMPKRLYFYITDLSMCYSEDSTNKERRLDLEYLCVITLLTSFEKKTLMVLPDKNVDGHEEPYASLYKNKNFLVLEDASSDDILGIDERRSQKKLPKVPKFPKNTLGELMYYDRFLTERLRYLYVWIEKKGDLSVPIKKYLDKGIAPFATSFFHTGDGPLDVPIWG